MARSRDAGEEEGAVDVHVEPASVITASVETTSPFGLPAGAEPASVITASVETTSPFGLPVGAEPASVITASVELRSPGLPADAEPATSPLELRAPTTSATSRGGDAPRVPLPRAARDRQDARGSEAASDEEPVSLVTARFDADPLVGSELAFADTVSAAEDDPALDEEDASELGTVPNLHAEEDGDDATLERDVGDRGVVDEPTVDERGRVAALRRASPSEVRGSSEPGDLEEDATTRQVSPAAIRQAREEAPAVDLPPMRPRMDSEAAGHWPPWHAQPDEVRAAVRDVGSPVGSGTEILPRSRVEHALSLVDSAAKNAPRESAPYPSPRAVPVSAPPAQRFEPVHDPSMTPRRPIDPARAGGAPPVARDAKRGISPVTVFVIAFLATGALFGGALGARRAGWIAFGEAVATPTSSEAPAVAALLRERCAGAERGAATAAAPSASAAPASSEPAPQASAARSTSAAPTPAGSAARPRTKAGPRPRRSPRTPR
ncbi:MAG: hypothetical protein KF795_11645 [Labilithrix sp.]|nr:hypothetical protein [Labilithrix sp.]